MPLIDKDKRVVLLLQGGGALGAYQVGAYEILQGWCAQEGRKIDWVAGISIGAINAAVIAGNEVQALLPTVVDAERYSEDRLLQRGDRCSRLEQLWDKILWPPCVTLTPFAQQFDSWLNQCSKLFPWITMAGLLPKYAGWNMAAWGGQRNFYKSRFLFPWQNPWITQWGLGSLPPDSLANYTVSPLGETLDELVNWRLINDTSNRDRISLSLGVTGVEDAEVTFFNSFDPESAEGWQLWGPKRTIKAEHVLASGALPPAFPAVRIDDEDKEEYYWDGGISSNTPLFDLRCELTTRDTIVFDILVWDRQGRFPQTMDELMWRQKCVQFGSRKKVAELVVENYGHYAKTVAATGETPPKLEIVQVMYEYENPDETNGPIFWFADAEFSRSSFEKLRRTGRKDMHEALQCPTKVKAVGDYAILYRLGSRNKHLQTDPED